MKAFQIDDYRQRLWPMPVRLRKEDGAIRRLGVEIELSGVPLDRVAELVRKDFGGKIDRMSDYESFVRDTELGDFGIELDFTYLKQLGREREGDIEAGEPAGLAENLLATLADRIVPYEVVGPPVPMDQLWRLETFIQRLRVAGAKGTRHSVAYAFGLHMNPDLPDLSTETILAYLRAFLCLYDWLKTHGKVDMTRRVTPYIDPFDTAYIQHVLNERYAPSQAQLISDYLAHNPTRNRALDLLPLFAYLDETRTRAQVQDDRIKPRPTFHYRLPNSEIDEAGWALIRPWRNWLQIEALAACPRRLRMVCRAYRMYLAASSLPVGQAWAQACTRWLIPELL